MDRLLEYKVVAYLKDDKAKEEQEKYREMGITMDSEEEQQEEKLVSYAFDPSTILEVRQTFVMYQNRWEDATIVVIGKSTHYDSPPLLVHYDEFKKDLKEWNETNKKINEAQ